MLNLIIMQCIGEWELGQFPIPINKLNVVK